MPKPRNRSTSFLKGLYTMSHGAKISPTREIFYSYATRKITFGLGAPLRFQGLPALADPRTTISFAQ